MHLNHIILAIHYSLKMMQYVVRETHISIDITVAVNRDQPIMLIILLIMLCCTAQKVHLLCLY